MLVKKIMKLLKNFFKTKKINANEVAIEIEENKYQLLDKYLKNRELINLYSNDSFVENIELEKTSLDFSIFIIETDGNSYSNYIKKKNHIIVNPNGKSICCSFTWWDSGNKQIYTVNPIITIEQKNISISNNGAGTVGASTAYTANANCIKITNIWAFKKQKEVDSLNEIINHTKDIISILAMLGIVIEVTPIKVNPISYIFKKIGKVINYDLNKEVKELTNNFNKLDSYVKENRKKELRIQISNFASDLRHGVIKSESQFISIIELCDEYLENKWNSKVKLDAQFIKDEYKNISNKIRKEKIRIQEEIMELETIFMLVTMVVTFLCGIISKKRPNFSDKLIPIQNVLIGLIVAVIEWIITKDFNTAIALSGLLAGGTYDVFHNLNKLLNKEEE